MVVVTSGAVNVVLVGAVPVTASDALWGLQTICDCGGNSVEIVVLTTSGALKVEVSCSWWCW